MKGWRSQRGSQIAEFGPALGIVLTIFVAIIAVFPFFVAYIAGYTMNFFEVREAAIRAQVIGISATITNLPDVQSHLATLDQDLQNSPILKALNMTISRPDPPFMLPNYDGTTRVIVVPSNFIWNSGIPFFGVKTLHYEGRRPVENIL
jgi:hypothetical protein